MNKNKLPKTKVVDFGFKKVLDKIDKAIKHLDDKK